MIYKAMAVVLAMIPMAAAQPAHLVRTQQGDDRKVFSYAFAEEGGSYLGIGPQDVTSDRVSALKLKEESGVEVVTVDADAPAGKAGIKEHDVILTINGAKMESVEQLRRTIREMPPGRTISLGVSRDGQLTNFNVKLGERPSPRSWEIKNMEPVPPMPPMAPEVYVSVNRSLGVGVAMQNLTPQLADFFGVKTGNGTLITSVTKDSPAAKAGLRAGDVVISVDKDPVHESSDLYNSLRSRKGSTVSLGVIREKREIKIALPVPDRKTGKLQSERMDFSAEIPDMNIDLPDFEEMHTRIAMAGPEMEKLHAEMQRAQAEFDRQRPEFDKAMAELKKRQEEISASAEIRTKELAEASAELSKVDSAKLTDELKPEMEKLQKDMESKKGEFQKSMRQFQRQMKKQQVTPQRIRIESSDDDKI
jgi:membrane-associated protease RseP (regulator of RpoE activity)/ribosomal protein S21